MAAGVRWLMLPRAGGEGEEQCWTCEPGRRRIDFFVASASLAGKVGVERVLAEAPLHPHRPVWLEVAVGGEPALVPVLDTPAPLIDPEGPGPQGPRPDAAEVWGRHLWRWAGVRSDQAVEGLWQGWSECAEGGLADCTGVVAVGFGGRVLSRRPLPQPPHTGRSGPFPRGVGRGWAGGEWWGGGSRCGGEVGTSCGRVGWWWRWGVW